MQSTVLIGNQKPGASGLILTSSIAVECGVDPTLTISPPIEVFPEVASKGQEWGNWGWCNHFKFCDILTAIYRAQGAKGATVSPEQFRSFRKAAILPDDKKPFNWVLKQKTLEGTLVSLHEGKDSDSCQFDWSERNQLYVLVPWARAVIGMALKGINEVIEKTPGVYVGRTFDNLEMPLFGSNIARPIVNGSIFKRAA